MAGGASSSVVGCLVAFFFEMGHGKLLGLTDFLGNRYLTERFLRIRWDITMEHFRDRTTALFRDAECDNASHCGSTRLDFDNSTFYVTTFSPKRGRGGAMLDLRQWTLSASAPIRLQLPDTSCDHPWDIDWDGKTGPEVPELPELSSITARLRLFPSPPTRPQSHAQADESCTWSLPGLLELNPIDVRLLMTACCITNLSVSRLDFHGQCQLLDVRDAATQAALCDDPVRRQTTACKDLEQELCRAYLRNIATAKRETINHNIAARAPFPLCQTMMQSEIDLARQFAVATPNWPFAF